MINLKGLIYYSFYVCIILLMLLSLSFAGSAKYKSDFDSQYNSTPVLEALFKRMITNKDFDSFEALFPNVTQNYLSNVTNDFNAITTKKQKLLDLETTGVKSAYVFSTLAKIYAIEQNQAKVSEYQNKVKQIAPNKTWE